MQSSPHKRRRDSVGEAVFVVGVLALIGFVLVLLSQHGGLIGNTASSATAQGGTAASRDRAVSLMPSPSLPQPSPSIFEAKDPLGIVVCDYHETNIDVFVRHTPLIVRGTVKQVLPAQWSTPDGKRPANPHAPDSVGTIYRPVILQVEEYLRGEQPQRTLMIMARGGTVGQDSVEFCGGNDPRYTYQEGAQVVLFLYPPEILFGPVPPATPGGPPLWAVWDRYTITADGQANSGARQVPIQQLRDEIQAAVRALPSPAP